MKEKIICHEGPCPYGVETCCRECEVKERCKDMCDQWECRKEEE